MDPLARRLAMVVGVALPTLAGPAHPALASEVAATIAGSGIRIIAADQVAREFCRTGADGVVSLVLPGGQTFELVTSTADAAVSNRGDGSFHPYDAAEVRAALDAVRFSLEGLSVDVYLLPFPRRDALDSGAGPGVILLSPGVAPMAAARQHAEFVHELGHVVQYRWLPDSDSRWSDYRRTRGIADESRFRAGAVHADRPHEIFAEDFRALFGGALATYSGSIENATIAPPAEVPGLDAFLRSLPGGGSGATRLIASANPARGPVSFAIARATESRMDLLDVSGRRIATLAPTAAGGQTVWTWDGRDEAGRRVPRGILLARVRGESGAITRVSWLP